MTSRYGLEIRAAAAADAAGLAELFVSSGLPGTASDLAGRIDSMRAGAGTVLIALEWGPPSGVVSVHWYRTLLADLPQAEISALLVAKDARRRGIGRLLVKAASQAARVAGCGTLRLPVAGCAQDLSAFCASTGFVQTGNIFARALRKGSP